jgi:hypothetical protein
MDRFGILQYIQKPPDYEAFLQIGFVPRDVLLATDPNLRSSEE